MKGKIVGADLITAFSVVSLASAFIGATLEYVGHSLHYNHRKGAHAHRHRPQI